MRSTSPTGIVGNGPCPYAVWDGNAMFCDLTTDGASFLFPPPSIPPLSLSLSLSLFHSYTTRHDTGAMACLRHKALDKPIPLSISRSLSLPPSLDVMTCYMIFWGGGVVRGE